MLLDLNLPDVSGLDGLIRLKKVVGDTPVLIVSSMFDDKLINAAIRAGASGFVPKHSQPSVFRAALAEVLSGGIFAPVELFDESETESAREAEALERLSTLTPQQARILQLVCEGKLNKQIAYELNIAETTVKAHITAILRKLGVQSRTQAVLISQSAKFSHLLQNSG